MHAAYLDIRASLFLLPPSAPVAGFLDGLLDCFVAAVRFNFIKSSKTNGYVYLLNCEQFVQPWALDKKLSDVKKRK